MKGIAARWEQDPAKGEQVNLTAFLHWYYVALGRSYLSSYAEDSAWTVQYLA